ncbi:hypothetical protein BDD43_4767 [Mucilaginibacter gracilis]|uniref:MG2 domain-containing protein n=1 Tax=Mucilaginibacter gracilis TaxID=423350 RepID=A0A495J6B0_9SPHI|nr:hypothetical protein [Mucilaginibacter gracilis]RKR84525.1 hypothetical protein BDD43_4767 [Mucilaginibacter gracilis]
MKYIRYTIKKTVLALLLTLPLAVSAQIVDGITSSFNQYHSQVLQEKVFVHVNKSFFLTGEILWFKVYTVSATLNKPVNISKIAYVEVLDNKNAPLLQAKINLINGIGTGSFYIPITATNGNYKLRAYTNLMKNFNANLYFEQAITIVNPLTPPVATVRQSVADNDIRFFPEGGYLVNGLKSRVAFKAVGPNGKGIDISGVVINQRNDTVAKFNTFKYGMGRFTFTPLANNSYKAVIRIGQTNALIKDLPEINKQGYVMQLTDAGTDQLAVTINAKLSGKENEPIYVLANSGQFVKVAETAMLSNGSAKLMIDKSKLGDGVSHITLFNSQKTPLCERLYFKRPKQLVVSASADRVTYHMRKKVSVDVNTKNDAEKPLPANLSVSVYKLDSLQTDEPAQISSYLWLKAELKGNIENADYYLKNNNAEGDEALDNLMMTQGWSRFKWNDVLSGPAPAFKFSPEYNGHLVTAKLTEAGTDKPVPSMIAYLAATGKKVQLYSAVSDSTGRLLFNTKDFYGPNELVLQLGIEKDSVYHLDILSPFSEQYSTDTLSNFSLNASLKRSLENNSINMQTQNLYSGAKLKQYYSPGVDSMAFYGKGKTYLLDDFTRFTTMEEVLREYVAELNVVKTQKRFHIKVKSDQGVFLSDDPLVMLDGVPIFNMDRVMAIDPLKVRKLEDIDRRFYLGPSTFEGILNFTTYKGDMAGFEINPHAVVLDYEGMQLQREFYSPVYDTDDKVKSRIPDFRNLLYWSPGVITDLKGNTQMSFYTSDEPGRYIGIVQGITADGYTGSKTFIFDVEK